jgi:hypothetical protein
MRRTELPLRRLRLRGSVSIDIGAIRREISESNSRGEEVLIYGQVVERLCDEFERLRKLEAEHVERRRLRVLEDWYEDLGPVLWWTCPVVEPPYCGTPLDEDFPEYMTHWTPLEDPIERTEAS